MFLKALVKTLNSSKIPYALVGGYAVALQGAVRGTVDVDICIGFSEKHFVEVEKLLLSLGLQPRLPVTGKEVFQFRKEYIENRNLLAWSFYNPNSGGEVVDVLITEDVRKMKTDILYFERTPVPVASKEDLIRMKKKAGRPQDLLDIQALEKILNEKN